MSRSNAHTPTQEAVVRFLAQGLPAAAAAAQAGVHRSTVYHWQRTNPLFATRLNESRHEVATHFLEQFHARADKALTTIDRLLDDPSTPAAVQARLALAILNAAATPMDPAAMLAQALDYTINAPMPGEDEASRYQDSALARSATDPAYRFDPEPEYETESPEFPDEAGGQSANLRLNPTNPTRFSSNEANFESHGDEPKAPTDGFPPDANHPAPVARTSDRLSRGFQPITGTSFSSSAGGNCHD